jgi:hypothetical protein
VRELEQLTASLVGAVETQKRKIFGFPRW